MPCVDGRAGQRLGGAQEAVGADLERLAAQRVALALLAAVAQRLRAVPGGPERAQRGGPGVAGDVDRVVAPEGRSHGTATSTTAPSIAKRAGVSRSTSPSTLNVGGPSTSTTRPRGVQDAVLAGEPAAPHAPGPPHERGARAGAQDGDVEPAVGLVGDLELGAAAEGARSRPR